MIKCITGNFLEYTSTDFKYLTSNWNQAPRHFFFVVSQMYLMLRILKTFATPQTFQTSETTQILQICVTFQIFARLDHPPFQTDNERLGCKESQVF